MFSMSNLRPRQIRTQTSAQQLFEDVKACGSPKGIRASMKEYENAKSSEYRSTFTKLAAGCGASASFLGLAPSLLTIVENCRQSELSKIKEATCGTTTAAAFGALLGLVGVGLTAYSLHLGETDLLKLLDTKDEELERRFRPVFLDDPQRSSKLLTRYSLLTEPERKLILEDLLTLYVGNPRPVRADPPAGHPNLEITVDDA